MNRSCQRQTQVLDLPVAAMVAAVPAPSVLKRTIRQRQTCFWGEDVRKTIASSQDRSSPEIVKETPVRITMARTTNPKTEAQFGLLRDVQSTSDQTGPP